MGNGSLEGLIYKVLVAELLVSARFFTWTMLSDLTAGPNPQKASVLYTRRRDGDCSPISGTTGDRPAPEVVADRQETAV